MKLYLKITLFTLVIGTIPTPNAFCMQSASTNEQLMAITFTQEEAQYLQEEAQYLQAQGSLYLQPGIAYNFVGHQCVNLEIHRLFQYIYNSRRTPYDFFFTTLTAKGDACVNILHALLIIHPLLINTFYEVEKKNSRYSQKYSQLTPCMIAARWGMLEVLKCVLSFRPNLEAQANTHGGNTALCEACKNGHATCVAQLLQAGAYPVTQSKHGNTPLNMAVFLNYRLIVSVFLEHYKNLFYTHPDGSDYSSLVWLINSKDATNKTPLAWAAHAGHATIVKLLLDYGADAALPLEIYAHGTRQRYALDWAKNGHKLSLQNDRSYRTQENYAAIIALLEPLTPAQPQIDSVEEEPS